ncbi:hypothetical protein Clacol_001510 [Clathrus columnatus]|uniref:BCD1 alpha/beta domain-containing protein n=1 Tax=Clathrus columnatus TaxID=1419009 RepID=A0AAV5A1Z6_9AGAM|nr:hypothetical protein Clacol_001510 [Clathrus columnatus]
MTNDFTYLEDVGRKTTEWGMNILKNGLMKQTKNFKNRPSRSHIVGGKKESLRLQLEARGIHAEMLPIGMEKSKLNKSFYDVKTKSILMTLEVIVHPPRLTTDDVPYIKIISHKHSLSSQLHNVLVKVLREYTMKVNDANPWLTQVSERGERSDVIFLMAQLSDMLPMLNVKIYHKLDPYATLQNILTSKTFVEYPTIEIWRDGDFTGILKEESGEISDIKTRAHKRPRLEKRVGNNVITSLLEDYASQDDEEGDKQKAILETLGDYSTDNEPLTHEDSNAEERFDNDGNFSEEDIRAVLDAAAQDELEQLNKLVSDGEDSESWNDSGDEDINRVQETLEEK